MFGGFASDYRVFSKMLRTLAQGCGSSAWVCAVHGEHNWVVGNFPSKRAARRVGRQSARRRLGELPADRHGRDSGRRSSAQRPLGLRQRLRLCAVDSAGARRKDGGDAEERECFSFRSSEVEIIDDWHVMGLCGTGSKSVAVKDVVVPDDRIRSACTSSRPAPRRAPRFIPAIRFTARRATCWRSFSLSSVNRRPGRAGGRGIRRNSPASAGRADMRVADLEAVQIDGGRGRGEGRDRGDAGRADHRPQHAAGRGRRRDHASSRSPGRGATRPTRRKLSLEAVSSLIFQVAGGSALVRRQSAAGNFP